MRPGQKSASRTPREIAFLVCQTHSDTMQSTEEIIETLRSTMRSGKPPSDPRPRGTFVGRLGRAPPTKSAVPAGNGTMVSRISRT